MATEFPESEQHKRAAAPGNPTPLSSDPGAVPLLPPGDVHQLPGQLETAPDGSIRPVSSEPAPDSLGTPGPGGDWSPGTAPQDFASPAPGLMDDAVPSTDPAPPGLAPPPDAPLTQQDPVPLSEPPLPSAIGAPPQMPAVAESTVPSWASSTDAPAASIGEENDSERAAWPTVEPDVGGGPPQEPLVNQPPAGIAEPSTDPAPATGVERDYELEALSSVVPEPTVVPPSETDEPEGPATSVQPPEPAASGEDMYDVPLGTLVYRSGLLSADQIESALAESERIGKRLGEVLIDSKMIDERDLGRLLAGQKGLPFLDLGQTQIEPAATDLLPAASARIYCALPLTIDDGKPIVAVSDPTNGLVVEGVRRAMGGELSFAVAARSDLQRAIASIYGEDREPDVNPPLDEAAAPAPPPVEEPIAEVVVAPPPVEPQTYEPAAAADEAHAPSRRPRSRPSRHPYPHPRRYSRSPRRSRHQPRSSRHPFRCRPPRRSTSRRRHGSTTRQFASWSASPTATRSTLALSTVTSWRWNEPAR